MTAKKITVWRVIKLLLIGAVVVFSSGAAGEICGAFEKTTPDSFGSSFPDNQKDHIRAAMTAVERETTPATRPMNSDGTPIAVMLVKGNPNALVGFDMKNGKELWKLTVPISSEVAVGSNSVVFKSGSNVACHDAVTGKLAWSFPIEPGFEYYGADAADGVVAVTIGVGGGNYSRYSNGRVLVRKESSGKLIFAQDTSGGLLGRPIVHGGHLFLPWDRQKIVVLKIKGGEEVARIRAADFTINHVEADSGAVYYGALSTKKAPAGIFRLDEASATGTREGSSVFVPDLDPIPGDPPFERDAFAKPVAGRSAMEKIRFHFKPYPGGSEPVAMNDNQFYLHYWRYIIAFDFATSRVRWTYASEEDIESIEPVAGGIVGVDKNGTLFFVDGRAGRETWTSDTGHEVLSAVFDADGFKPAGPATDRVNPIEGLVNLIKDRDNRLFPIQAWSISLLAKEPSPDVTKTLLDTYADTRTPKGLKKAIVAALESRKAGTEYLLYALDTHYNFLTQTASPPLNVVAPALANAGETSAVPDLLRHLLAHETPIEHLTPTAAALHHLADASVVIPLKEFLTLYHADSSFIGHEEALGLVAETIAKLDNKQMATQYLKGIATDEQTLTELAKVVDRILDPMAAMKKESEERAKAEAKEKEREKIDKEVAAEAGDVTAMPETLARSQINRVVATGKEAFKPCVVDAMQKSPTLQSIRMRFVIRGTTGEASNLRILPANIAGLQKCLESALLTVTFPKFTNHSQTATYTLKLRK